ncbi:hypothetical protein N657DRAFT_584095 [Parathielavia appendiculata]|uniref:AA1-like domain-containing protein n=1 Tax=Parathielavia appendiculata TaxID=2587402 RepID=A0AAN6YXW0_9PEZI|nr:hypothetical protein N657DRAFT_584095 [Parathielavia appendiculata]
MQFRTYLSLLPLLGLTATALPIPSPDAADTSASPAGCSDISFKSFAWIARNIDFHASYTFTTPAHQNSWGYASFDLYNPADQSTAHCEAASNQLNDFFYGTVPYKCNDTQRVGSTSFDFARPNNRLRVNQTWTCNDKEPQWPATFTGRGDVNLTLSCNETTWENPNWTIGQIYSSREIKCAAVQAVIKPYEMEAIA